LLEVAARMSGQTVSEALVLVGELEAAGILTCPGAMLEIPVPQRPE